MPHSGGDEELKEQGRQCPNNRCPGHTASPTNDAEFVDAPGLQARFGIKRSLAYTLLAEGAIRGVSLRRRGLLRGKRLFDVASVSQLPNGGRGTIRPAKNKRGSAFVRDSGAVSTRKTHAGAEGESKKGYFYKPLPKEFRRDGFIYEQIAREGNAAIYEQIWSGCPNPNISYEVIRIRRREGFQIGGRFVEPAEVYPKSEAWGVDGFTLSDKEAAFAKLREVGRK